MLSFRLSLIETVLEIASFLSNAYTEITKGNNIKITQQEIIVLMNNTFLYLIFISVKLYVTYKAHKIPFELVSISVNFSTLNIAFIISELL
jgi:hypothetical protein